MTKLTDPQSMLPLTPSVFQILLALSDRERHGYAIMREVETQTTRLRLGPGTLYGCLKRMLAAGLVEEKWKNGPTPIWTMNSGCPPHRSGPPRDPFRGPATGRGRIRRQKNSCRAQARSCRWEALMPATCKNTSPTAGLRHISRIAPRLSCEFRLRYGIEMHQVFRDQLRDALSKQGIRGLLTFCMRTAWDLCKSIPRERLTLQSLGGMVCLAVALGFAGYATYVDHHNVSEVYPTLMVVLVGWSLSWECFGPGTLGGGRSSSGWGFLFSDHCLPCPLGWPPPAGGPCWRSY